jgi:fatty acid desaturase
MRADRGMVGGRENLASMRMGDESEQHRRLKFRRFAVVLSFLLALLGLVGALATGTWSFWILAIGWAAIGVIHIVLLRRERAATGAAR